MILEVQISFRCGPSTVGGPKSTKWTFQGQKASGPLWSKQASLDLRSGSEQGNLDQSDSVDYFRPSWRSSPAGSRADSP